VADQIRKTDAAVRAKGSKITAKPDEPGEVGEIIDLVKVYVRQETVGPLKGLGRKIGIGVAGSILIGLGLFFFALGLLRLIQDKIPRLARGGLSWVSYLIVVAFCGLVTVVALSRIKKIEKELN
jgi:hypothetical protein